MACGLAWNPHSQPIQTLSACCLQRNSSRSFSHLLRWSVGGHVWIFLAAKLCLSVLLMELRAPSLFVPPRKICSLYEEFPVKGLLWRVCLDSIACAPSIVMGLISACVSVPRPLSPAPPQHREPAQRQTPAGLVPLFFFFSFLLQPIRISVSESLNIAIRGLQII